MFSNTVLKIHLCFILGLLVLMMGCSITQTAQVSVVDVAVPPPAIVRKIPMKVTIVIPNEVETYSFTGGSQIPDLPSGDTELGWNVVMTVPLG